MGLFVVKVIGQPAQEVDKGGGVEKDGGRDDERQVRLTCRGRARVCRAASERLGLW